LEGDAALKLVDAANAVHCGISADGAVVDGQLKEIQASILRGVHMI